MAERKNPGIPLGCVSDGGAYLPEREKVRELRMREMGCAEIAGRLGIPEGTVILHCLKLGLPVTGPCRRIPLPKTKVRQLPGMWEKDHPAAHWPTKEVLFLYL